MNRIWNCITRGLRARAPAPQSQTSSQCNEDNESTLHGSVEQENLLSNNLSTNSNQFFKTRYQLLLAGFHNSYKNKEKQNDGNQKSFNHSNTAESFMSKAVSALFFGQVVRYISTMVYKTYQDLNYREKFDVSVALNNLVSKSTFFTVQSMLPSVPIKSTVQAAGKTVPSTESDSAADLNSKSKLNISVSKVNASKKDELLIDDDHMDKFVSSIKQSVGLTYNLQGVRKYKQGNYLEAFQFFQLASQSGAKQGQFNLGICYQQGKGTKKNAEKARQEFQRAARQGHGKAQYNLGIMLTNKNDLINFRHGLFMLEKSAENGFVQAQALVGAYFAQDGVCQNMKKAVKMFKLAAEQEDTLSTYHLAECYEHGLGGLKVDTCQAFDLYATAASQGHHEAHYKMALILLSDCPEIEKNKELALEILKKAKELGHEASAQKYNELMNAEKHEEASASLTPNQSVPFDCLDISQLIFPGLLQKLCPLHDLPEHQFVSPSLTPNNVSHPSNSFSYSTHFHRVPTWPVFPSHDHSLVPHQSK